MKSVTQLVDLIVHDGYTPQPRLVAIELGVPHLDADQAHEFAAEMRRLGYEVSAGGEWGKVMYREQWNGTFRPEVIK